MVSRPARSDDRRSGLRLRRRRSGDEPTGGALHSGHRGSSNLFKKGHRIRVYVSSSNFPRFNRNLNTGEPILGRTGMVKASQTIYHDAEHPSALILPVIPPK